MYKKLLLILAFCTIVFADSIALDFYAKSKHQKSDLNQKHGWLGFNYRFIETKNYKVQIEYANFKNSFADRTQIATLTGIYTPINYKDFSLGFALATGIQKGYCTLKKECKKGQDNKSFIALPYLYAQYQKMQVSLLYVPKEVTAIRIGFKVLEFK